MDKLKRYASAAITGVLALVLTVVGILALTVFKPAQEVSARATGSQLYMTRDGVLPLLADSVVVEASTTPSADVTIAMGTSADVLGWIGEAAYVEVVGIESGEKTLKVESHPARALSGEVEQSGARSAAQSSEAAQSGEGAQSGGLATPAGSDMWLDEATGTGSARLSLSGVTAGRSVIVATSDPNAELDVRLIWPVERANLLATISFVCAALAAVIALIVLALRLQRDHAEARGGRPAAQLALDEADGEGSDAPADTAVGTGTGIEEAEDDEDDAVEDAVDEAGQEGLARAWHPVHGGAERPAEHAVVEQPGTDTDEEDHTVDEVNALIDETLAADTSDADDVDGTGGDAPTPEVETPAADVSGSGRHGLARDNMDEDLPERAPTDTGTIDLRAIRSGARSFPSRRALREARERGEEKVTVDGHDFPTGLVPIVKKVEATDAPEAEQDGNGTRPAPGSWTALLGKWRAARNEEGEAR